jgi:hypothetical protein
MTMQSDPWTAKLSEYLDGDLSEPERAAVERHLASCPTCRATLADLARVVERARSLPERPPAADLWAGIAARLEPRAKAPAPEVRSLGRRRWSFSLPELAAAAAIIAVVSGGGAWWLGASGGSPPGPLATMPAPRSGQPTVSEARSPAERGYDAAVADLERVLASGRGALDTLTVRILEQNLATIDRAIADARRALQADPGSAYLNAHLARTMRRKIDLLRQAAALVATPS